MSKNRDDYQQDYTHPELRERLKEELKASGRGGRPGQWSARKSQLLTQEYEEHGGGYRHPQRPTRSQQDLAEWTEQRWMTESGSANARHGGSTERYLPEQAWAELSPAERRETQRAKRAGSRRGEQRAPNPPAAKSARKVAELDALPAREAARRARKLTAAEAKEAQRHEREHKARKTVLRELDKMTP
ncbi:hypothetical protein OOZ19_03100 [Saccharopolyspora sp. NFXS83]|uniref:hypothetical protein n=1 Tax=Saccharopolyspora sp. NFXS83 TaxID=2993560 RepID=UPI00224A8C80|nr:hypothetical protein [Saccharopolyspora sp. NFXS83]MCX2729214.1 hypothetical protein [Saccharopolyspora sp. NFXS83]